jgi:hypothetical protein
MTPATSTIPCFWAIIHLGRMFSPLIIQLANFSARMSRLLPVFVSAIVLVAANASTRGEEAGILLHQADAYLGTGTNQWWLPPDRLERLPRWRGEGSPPVSIKQALKIARKWISPKSGNGDIDHILLRPINPDASESKYRSCYFYTIEFSVSPYGNHITCVVLMDGTVLEPKSLAWREPSANKPMQPTPR